MLTVRMLVIQVVAGPELHGQAPSNQVLGKTTENEGAVSEQAGATLFVEVTVAEHGGVCVEVTDTGGTLRNSLFELVAASSQDPKIG